jgi:hypothetical protein
MLRRKRKDAMASKTKTVGYGYVGRWGGEEHALGWFLPKHLCGSRLMAESPNDRAELFVRKGEEGEQFVLCRITVEQVFDCNGRPITRRVKHRKPEKPPT